jgi:hypothetical protein
LLTGLGHEVKLPHALKNVHPICVVSDHYPALTFQAQQFLVFEPTNRIEPPLICDVFFIDVVTEFLETPLRILSYLELRARVGDNLNLSNEIVALGFHLRRNLWLGEYDFMLLHDDVAGDVHVAMAARREGIKGQQNPPGILTQLKGTTVGRIVEETERHSEPAAIATGLELLKLSGKSAKNLSRMLDKIVAAAAKNGTSHDATILADQSEVGITVHCNGLPDETAGRRLQRHCETRKYVAKVDTWCGLVLEPGSGTVRFGLMLDYAWKQDLAMDAIVSKLPGPTPVSNIMQNLRAEGSKKVGRNAPCPCGSRLKYKKCHLLKGGSI